MTLRSITVPLLGLGLLAAPVLAVGQAGPQGQAYPGTVNYVEGAVSLDGQTLNARDVGNAALAPGQELTTGAGKAEILLTPGVFLRLDSNSTVQMISPDLTLTQVEIRKGRAGVEVDEIHEQNNLQVIVAGVATRLEKDGYYEFDANRPEVMVFKGKADVEVADAQTSDKTREVKDHHEFALVAGEQDKPFAQEKPTNFNTRNPSDSLYNWSSLRSQYLAEANNQMAGEYATAGYNPGWYWDPYMWDYTFIGAGPFYSPFGWGFYPLGWGWGGWYGGRFGSRGGFVAGGFHGGMSGGFHGGGGGRR